ncbi:MAG: NusG domain II-containing protein [Oscillospiraceae bacterium]|jgi:hypothetical protein|nr:NusG domain II-containing protein [Oscillospiraceae bacterium]
MFNKKILTKKDLILVGILLAAAIICILLANAPSRGGGLTAVITQDGRLLYSVELSSVKEPYTIKIDGDYPLEIRLESKAVQVQNASCKDKLCMASGRLDRAGQQAVCLPNRTVVRIVSSSDKSEEWDAVTG